MSIDSVLIIVVLLVVVSGQLATNYLLYRLLTKNSDTISLTSKLVDTDVPNLNNNIYQRQMLDRVAASSPKRTSFDHQDVPMPDPSKMIKPVETKGFGSKISGEKS